MTRLERTRARKERQVRRVLFSLCVLLLAASVVIGTTFANEAVFPPPTAEAQGSAGAESSTTGRSRPGTPTTSEPPEQRSPGPSVTKAPSPTRGGFSLAAGGDVIGDRKVGELVDARGGAAVFAAVAPVLRDADVAFVNLESPLSDKGTRDTEKDVTLRGRPALVTGLRSAGIDVVSLANNHQRDWGAEALLDTIARLKRAGVASTGAGKDLAAAREPSLLDSPGGRVAFLAFSVIQPAGGLAGVGRAGINPGREDRARLLADVRAAKQRAGWVVVSVHWGDEYDAHANADQRQLAHEVIDAGADVILGHHPHVLQGLELYHGALIAYSLGDFVFDHRSRETGETVIARLGLDPSGPPTVELIPVYLSDSHGIPAVVKGGEAAAILKRIRSLSAELGTPVELRGDRAFVGAATPPNS